MSPRPVKMRRIGKPPVISGMKPYGFADNRTSSGKVFLNLEEYESLRLCDFYMLHQCQAAEMMGVSRPTLTRIYSSARMKIAEAIVEGKQIVIEGGKIYFDSSWYFCNDCGCFFNNPGNKGNPEKCPLCGSTMIVNYDLLPEMIYKDPASPDNFCYYHGWGRKRAGKRRRDFRT
ncbi:MAG TPA: DUF134 domain-containing protein [Bacteroidales bacterium]|mgnify:FL=1|nr:DUF134 domain-containing protein [Bacteroidales bacterium]